MKLSNLKWYEKLIGFIYIYKKHLLAVGLIALFSVMVSMIIISGMKQTALEKAIIEVNNKYSEDVSFLSSELEKTNVKNDIIVSENKILVEKINELQEFNSSYIRDLNLDVEYQEFLYKTCVELGLDYDIQLAKISLESNFNVNARNTNNNGTIDYGLSQINSANLKTMDDMGLDVINDPYDNIYGGCYIYYAYKNKMLDRGYFGEELIIRSLNSYNMGVAGFDNYVKNGNHYNDWKYAKAVMHRMKKIKLESGVE